MASKEKEASSKAPQITGLQRGLVARALDGMTGAAIFWTGPSRWPALLRDEPGYKYGIFFFKDQCRDRRVRVCALTFV